MDERLRSLSEQFSANSENRLRLVAKQHGLKASKAELQQALGPRAHANELFAPPPRSLGKSAAERPGARLQADLIDFSKNTDSTHKYGLLVSDVYSRMAYTKPLETKSSQEVTEALNEVVADIPGTAGGRMATLTTDAGGEFAGADSVKGIIHRVKGEGDRNAIAVVDRTMQTLKKDLAGEVAVKGGSWSDHLAHVTKAFDTRYQPAVHGPPSKLVSNPNTVQNFLTLQDNAEKFAHNDTLTRRRKGDLERLGGYRDPISSGQRSFKASYGPVHELDAVLPGALKVRDTEGNESLLKLVKAVPKGSGEAVASMTKQTEPVKRKAPVAGSGVPMGRIPTAAGTPLEEARKKSSSSSSTPQIPQSSAASGSRPESREERFGALRSLAGYKPKLSQDEIAQRAAAAAEKKRLAEAAKADRLAKQEARHKAAVEKEFERGKKQAAKIVATPLKMRKV